MTLVLKIPFREGFIIASDRMNNMGEGNATPIDKIFLGSKKDYAIAFSGYNVPIWNMQHKFQADGNIDNNNISSKIIDYWENKKGLGIPDVRGESSQTLKLISYTSWVYSIMKLLLIS